MFESTKMQTKLRTNEIEPNENISFPIGTLYLVKRLYENLNLSSIFGKHKTRGIDINNLLQALVSYKMTDNFSIKRSHKWINRPEVLDEFNLPSFSERTLYRVLETLGANREVIILDIQDVLFERYAFEHTNINMDWTSLVLHGTKAPLGKYGYSRDHRPDKKQITIGVTELADPINVPIGMTIEPGNLNDQIHFKKTYQQSSGRLREGSLVIFDKGANSVANTQMIRGDNMQYITGKKLNKSDDKIIAKFETYNPQVVDEGSGIRGIMIEKPNSTNYLYFLRKAAERAAGNQGQKSCATDTRSKGHSGKY